jgi:hypothetical protein
VACHDACIDYTNYLEDSVLSWLLPIDIECKAGGVVIGSTEIPKYLALSCVAANGVLRTCKAKSPLDQFQMRVFLNMQNVEAHILDNTDYVDTAVRLAARFREANELHKHNHRCERCRMNQGFFTRIMRRLAMRNVDMDIPLQENLGWRGLSRFRRSNEHNTYARDNHYKENSQVIKASQIDLIYYADVVGQVPASWERNTTSRPDVDIGNSDTNPQWGIDLKVHTALIHYGPWADRQRYRVPFVYRYICVDPSSKTLLSRSLIGTSQRQSFSSQATGGTTQRSK